MDAAPGGPRRSREPDDEDDALAGARPVGPGARRHRWAFEAGTSRFPWLGVLLVLVGVALLVRQLEPRIGVGTLLLMALGLAFAGAWLFGRIRWALVPALLLVALAASRLLREIGLIAGEGWTTLFLGGALLVAWLVGRVEGGRHGWALWLGGLLLLVGLSQVSGRIPGIPDLGVLWPLVIIVAGVVLILVSSVAARRGAP